ncbi:hypothetical protein AAC387_Pa04g2094 [Persea americana]
MVNPAKYNSIFSGLSILLKEKAPSSLWRGWGGKYFRYGAQSGCKFGLYEYFKRLYLDVLPHRNRSAIYFLSSASAQVIADIALCQFEAVKVRFQTQPKFGKGLIDGFPKLYATDGLSGFYRGLVPLWGGLLESSTTWGDVSLAMQQVPFVQLSNPADNIVASLYNKKADNVMQAVKKIGLVNLFTRSLPIRITMEGPVITMQWLFYDTVKVLTGLEVYLAWPTSGGADSYLEEAVSTG